MSNINGTASSDSLTGSTASDQILGFQGDDTIDGGGGSDTIYGGKGSDEIFFGIGNGTTFDQPGANGSSYVVGGEGADTITSFGGLGNNTILGGTGVRSVDTTADFGDDIDATADRGRDIILGNDGDDSIGIGVGGASAFGGMGNDVIYDTGSTFYENGTLGQGGVGEDLASPNTNGSANDVIFGGEGRNTIDVSAFGNSTIVGGTGNPSTDVSLDGADLIVLDDAATSVGQNGNTGLTGNDLILGNYGDDTISASGLVLVGSFPTEFGVEQLSSGQSTGGTDTLVGGMGNDQIFAGQQANDILLGNEGNDLIINLESRTGTDTIYGGLGDDTVLAGSEVGNQTANQLIYGGEGNDFILTAGTGNDTLFGGIDSTGGSADGSNAFDIEAQTAGNDLIFGGPNSDYIIVGTTDAAATVTGGAGSDTVSFVNELGEDAPDDGGSAFNGSGRDTINDFTTGVDEINNPQPVTYVDVEQVIAGNGTLDDKASTALADARNNRGADNQGVGVNAAIFQVSAGGDHYLAIDNGGTNGQYDQGTDLLINLKGATSVSLADFVSAPDSILLPDPNLNP